MSAFLNITKELSGKVLVEDANTGFVYKELDGTAALFTSDRFRDGGVWIIDVLGEQYHLETADVLTYEIKPLPPFSFSGNTRNLYELLEQQHFYNLVNPPSGGSGLTNAANGISVRSGNTAILGGTLDQATIIDAAGFPLTISNGSVTTLSGGQIRTVLSQGVNYTILNNDYAIEATASITLTLPASPTIGQSHEIFANNNIVQVNANVGQTIIGRASVNIRRYSSIIIRYTSTNNWLII